MYKIIEKQELNIYNLCCFRGKVTRQELQNIGLEMEKYIETCGGKKVGNPVSATYGIDGDLVDIELLIPIDKPIQSNGRYIYKEQLKLTNALMADYKGNPTMLSEAGNALNDYMVKNKLQPITVGYNVSKNIDVLDPDSAEIEIYVGINPNIL